jgi:hypothetical protein
VPSSRARSAWTRSELHRSALPRSVLLAIRSTIHGHDSVVTLVHLDAGRGDSLEDDPVCKLQGVVMTNRDGRTSAELLAEVLDRQDIHDCLLRYARGLDRHDAELAKSAYHEDARDDHTLYVGSGYGLVDWANKQHDATGVCAHQHYLLNTTIDLEGDEAHVETYFVFAGTTENFQNTLGGGRYVDRFERRLGRWGIAARRLIVEWWQDPAELKMLNELGERGVQGPGDASYLRPLTVQRADRIEPLAADST